MKEIVLVTGSSGLIGQATARRLAPRYDVIGLDSKPPRRTEPMLEHVHVDLTADDSVETALRHIATAYGTRIASFIHLAAYYDFSGEPSPLYEQVTVRGTERLLQKLQRLDCEQLIFSSSMLVHAPTEKGRPITEDSPLDPRWDYPRSKVETERLLHERRGQIPTVILRIAGVYDDRCHSIPIANQIQRIFERRLLSHVFPGDTSTGQAFVHLDDVVEAFALIVERRHALPAELTLLIGEPETLSYDELQQRLGRLIHDEEQWQTRQVPKTLAKAGAWLQDQLPAGEEPFIKPWMIDLADDHFELDISRARSLGWEPCRTLRSTLPVMVAELKQDPLGWYRENKLVPPAWLERRMEQRDEPQPQAP